MHYDCYTNGDAHGKIWSVLDSAGDVSQFFSICILHAAKNVGTESSLVLLALFWNLIQKKIPIMIQQIRIGLMSPSKHGRLSLKLVGIQSMRLLRLFLSCSLT